MSSASGESGARGVPVLHVLNAASGRGFSPSESASLVSVQGDKLTVQLWERREGEYEVSPSRTASYDLKAIG